MTNLEKLIEVFGCKEVREINKGTPDALVKVDLDGETAFFKSWCDEEYEPKANEEFFDVKGEIDILDHKICELYDFMEKYYDTKINEVERKIDKCWNRVGKVEQNIREITSELETMNRNINNLTPPLKEQTEEEFLKSLRSIKVVRIK